jgi:adenylate kinase family enzyme
MGKNNTKIVEFSGLPASGKTTITEYLQQRGMCGSTSIAKWNDLTREYKHSSIFKKIGSISIKKIVQYIRLYHTFVKSNDRKWFFYWYPIKHSIVYQFCKKYSHYDFALIDHGILQNMVSLQCGLPLFSNQKAQMRIKNVINAETKPDLCIYCQVNIDTAMDRMATRNRVNDGRLDSATDLCQRRDMFIKEKVNFEIVCTLLNEKNSSWIVRDVQTNRSMEEIRTELENIFQEVLM